MQEQVKSGKTQEPNSRNFIVRKEIETICRDLKGIDFVIY